MAERYYFKTSQGPIKSALKNIKLLGPAVISGDVTTDEILIIDFPNELSAPDLKSVKHNFRGLYTYERNEPAP